MCLEFGRTKWSGLTKTLASYSASRIYYKIKIFITNYQYNFFRENWQGAMENQKNLLFYLFFFFNAFNLLYQVPIIIQIYSGIMNCNLDM